jgi:hypothetical protein
MLVLSGSPLLESLAKIDRLGETAAAAAESTNYQRSIGGKALFEQT